MVRNPVAIAVFCFFALGNGPIGRLASETLNRGLSSIASRSIEILLEGKGKIDFASIAADSFGSALGNSIVGHLRYTEAEKQSRTAQMRITMAHEEAARDGGSSPSAGSRSPVHVSAAEYDDLARQFGSREYGVAVLERLGINRAVGSGGGIRTFAYHDSVSDLGRPVPIAPTVTIAAGGSSFFDRSSMNDYWNGAQDRAVANGNFLAYSGAGVMRLLGNAGYGAAETGMAMYNDPASALRGVGQALINFGPESFNGLTNLTKTSLDGLTLLAESAGAPTGFFSGFREADPYNIGLLAPYANSAEAGGALLTGLGVGAGLAKFGNYAVRPPVLFAEPSPSMAYTSIGLPPIRGFQNPLVPPGTGQLYQSVVNDGIAFNSSAQLRAAMSPGSGYHVHHIVEQTPGNLSRFGTAAIQNTANAVPLIDSVHVGRGSISAYYSSIDPAISTQVTVRQWLSSQSYEAQYNFGMLQLQRFGVSP